jgi:tetratricopeptide (TPR) repeat protein
MSEDDFWFNDGSAPGPPPKDRTWIWVLGTVLLGFGMLAAFGLFYLLQQQPGGFDFTNFAESLTNPDDSDVVPFDSPETRRRIQDAAQVYESQQPIGGGVSDNDVARIQTALQNLEQALETDDAARFRALVDVTAFRSRVRQSESLTPDARMSFASQFDGWMQHFSPSLVSRIKLVAIRRDSVTNFLMAYTWVYVDSEYSDPWVWYFHLSQGELKLVDFDTVDTALLYSDRTAREFSAAHLDSRWDNFVELYAVNFSFDDSNAAASALRDFADLSYPNSVKHWAWQLLARQALYYELDDLCLELCDRAGEVGAIPVLHWYRATVHMNREEYPQALAALERYRSQVGDCPSVCLLKAAIFDATNRSDEATAMRLGSLEMDVEQYIVPWAFWSQISPDHAPQLAKAVSRTVDPQAAACSLATSLLLYERDDLAQPIIDIALAAPASTPAQLRLEASIARFRGDRDTALQKQADALAAAGKNHPDFVAWQSEWVWSMVEANRAAEAVRLSSTPGQTFSDLVLDPDEVSLTTTALTQVIDVLSTIDATDTPDGQLVKLWHRIAPGVLYLKKHEYEHAYAVFLPLLKEVSAVASTEHSDAGTIEEHDMSWSLQSWAVQSAVQCGKTTEISEWLDDDTNPGWTLAWQAKQARQPDAIDEAVAVGVQHDPQDPLHLYYSAAAHQQLGETAAAIAALRQFLANEMPEESWEWQAAGTQLANLLVRSNDWPTLLDDLSPEMTLHTLGRLFQHPEHIEEMARLLDMQQIRSLPFENTVAHRAWLHHQRRDWAALRALYDEWKSQPMVAEFGEAEYYWGISVYHEQFLDGLLQSGDIAEAQNYTEQLAPEVIQPDWQAKIAFATGDDEQLSDILLTDDLTYGSDIRRQLFAKAIDDQHNTDALKLAEQFPPRFYAVCADSNIDTAELLIVLLNEAATIDESQLTTAMQDVFPVAQVQALTDDLHTLETQFSKIRNDNEMPSPSARQLFRVTSDTASALISIVPSRLDSPHWIESSASELVIPDRVCRTAYDAHQAVLVCQFEHATDTPDGTTSAATRNTMAVALVKHLAEDAVAISIDQNLHVVNPQLVQSLSSSWGPLTENGTDIFHAAVSTSEYSSARQFELRRHLRTRSPSDATESVAVYLQWNSLLGIRMLPCRVTAWTPKSTASELTIRLPRTALIPERLWGTTVIGYLTDVIDWVPVSAESPEL